MKVNRNVLLFAFLLTLGMLAGCKTHERCPAYGKAASGSVQRPA
jgi:hypothetical protein